MHGQFFLDVIVYCMYSEAAVYDIFHFYDLVYIHHIVPLHSDCFLFIDVFYYGNSCSLGSEDACNDLNCDKICHVTEEGSARCACPQGYRLSADGKTCSGKNEIFITTHIHTT